MSRDRFWQMRIRQTMLADHIRRIACHHIKRSCPKNPGSLFNITFNDLYSVLKTVIFHTAVSHLGTLCLDLQAGKMLPFSPLGKQDRNDSRPGSHIQRSLSLFYPGKAGKQHSVHTKAEFLRILDHKITILKIIHPLTTLNQIIFHLVLYLPFSLRGRRLYPFSS